MPKDTREKVTLRPEAFQAIEVGSTLMGVSLKDAASHMVLKSAHPKCKEISGITARLPKGQEAKVAKGHLAQVPEGTIAKKPKANSSHKAKRPTMAGDSAALEKIKEIWDQ